MPPFTHNCYIAWLISKQQLVSTEACFKKQMLGEKRQQWSNYCKTAKLKPGCGHAGFPVPTRRLEMFGALFFIRQCKTILHPVTKPFSSGHLGPHKQWKIRWGILSPSGDPSKKKTSLIYTKVGHSSELWSLLRHNAHADMHFINRTACHCNIAITHSTLTSEERSMR